MILNITFGADISLEQFQRLLISDRYQMISRVCAQRSIPFVPDQIQLQEVFAPNNIPFMINL